MAKSTKSTTYEMQQRVRIARKYGLDSLKAINLEKAKAYERVYLKSAAVRVDHILDQLERERGARV